MHNCLPPEIFQFDDGSCKATFEMDVFNFGIIMKELESKCWGNLEELFEKPMVGVYSKLQCRDESNMMNYQKNLKSSYFKEIITPKLVKVSMLLIVCVALRHKNTMHAD